MQRVQEELRGYADRGGQKRPSYREQYNKRIQELEQQSARDSPNSQFYCFISPAYTRKSSCFVYHVSCFVYIDKYTSPFNRLFVNNDTYTIYCNKFDINDDTRFLSLLVNSKYVVCTVLMLRVMYCIYSD